MMKSHLDRAYSSRQAARRIFHKRRSKAKPLTLCLAAGFALALTLAAFYPQQSTADLVAYNEIQRALAIEPAAGK